MTPSQLADARRCDLIPAIRQDLKHLHGGLYVPVGGVSFFRTGFLQEIGTVLEGLLGDVMDGKIENCRDELIAAVKEKKYKGMEKRK